MAPRICVLGSVNLDLVIQTAQLPKAGETIGGGTYSAQPGGKGANIALAAKRLGANVTLLAAVGSDDYGEQALSNLKAEGVDLTQLKRKPAHTGLAFINVSETGENQIAVAAGANGAFKPEDLPRVQADALITQFEIPPDTVLAAVKNFDGSTCLNPSPVIDDIAPYLPHTDLLIVNESEAHAYGAALSSYSGLLVKTLGAKGAVMSQNGLVLTEARPPMVEPVDTTGAGDGFAAALTLALLENMPNQTALNFACTVGALSTTKLGAQSAYPLRADVNTYLENFRRS